MVATYSGAMPGRRAPDPVRITTAPVSRAAELAARQRRYLISMGIRTVCFVAAVLVGPGPLRWVLVAAAILLPYVSVVFANTQDRRAETYLLDDPGGTTTPAELPHGQGGDAGHARPA
jgi:Protein of unknown function (DUF3099)